MHSGEVAGESRFWLSSVYGHDWRTKPARLLKYRGQHMCSRIAETDVPRPPPLIEYLDGREARCPPHVRLDLTIQPDFMRLALTWVSGTA